MEKTTITISKEFANKLNQYKYKLKCKTIEELIERLLDIQIAKEYEQSALNQARELLENGGVNENP
jgi:glutamate synthase domain-containing protein 1